MSATRTSLLLLASAALTGIFASCASEGDEPASPGIGDGGAADASNVLTPPDTGASETCRDGHWCAVAFPLSAPASLNGIWGSGPSDVWIVGSPDVVIHWNGAEFTSVRLNTNQTLFGIWGSGPSDIWAFSTGDALWHKAGGEQGHSWSGIDRDAGGDPPVWSAPIFGMWGRSATDIWAVGRFLDSLGQATVWHSEGWNAGAPSWVSTLTTPGANPWDPEPSFNAIWGSDRGEVWVVGDKGKTRYSSGWNDGAATWTVVDSGTSLPLYAVWSAGNGEVWAAGAGGTVRRFRPSSDGTIAVDEIGFPSRATVRALSGFAGDDIWAAGSDGTLAHWDGSAWSLDEDAALHPNELFALWASGPDDIWAVGQNVLLHKGNKLPGTTP